MQTWYALCRSWGDGDEDGEDAAWSPFGVDDLTGRPVEFVGAADDALRQLEDELRPTITASTRVEHHDRRLLIVRFDEQCGGTDFAEYRLVDRAARPPGPPRTPSPPRPRMDRSGRMPNRFLHEFHDVAEAVPIDLNVTLAHLDVEAGTFVANLLIQVIDVGDDVDPEEAIRNLMSVMLWVFLIGREHARRGYAEPVPPAEPEPAESGPAESGPAEEPEKPFWGEFHEVTGDVVVDYRATMLDLDEDVGRRINAFVVELVHLAERDEAKVIMLLLSGALWMFRLGREHANRGYSAPVPRGDGRSWIPDTLDAFF